MSKSCANDRTNMCKLTCALRLLNICTCIAQICHVLGRFLKFKVSIPVSHYKAVSTFNLGVSFILRGTCYVEAGILCP